MLVALAIMAVIVTLAAVVPLAVLEVTG